jgi:hypothetical protein
MEEGMKYLRIDMVALKDPESEDWHGMDEVGDHCFFIGPLSWDDGKEFSMNYLLGNKELFHNQMEYVRRAFVREFVEKAIK